MPTAKRPPNRQIVLPKDWRDWRGTLAGSGALEDHLREHRDEVATDR